MDEEHNKNNTEEFFDKLEQQRQEKHEPEERVNKAMLTGDVESYPKEACTTGDLFFDTKTNSIMIYNGSKWIATGKH